MTVAASAAEADDAAQRAAALTVRASRIHLRSSGVFRAVVPGTADLSDGSSGGSATACTNPASQASTERARLGGPFRVLQAFRLPTDDGSTQGQPAPTAMRAPRAGANVIARRSVASDRPGAATRAAPPRSQDRLEHDLHLEQREARAQAAADAAAERDPLVRPRRVARPGTARAGTRAGAAISPHRGWMRLAVWVLYYAAQFAITLGFLLG